jgi:hypothetical protein
LKDKITDETKKEGKYRETENKIGRKKERKKEKI